MKKFLLTSVASLFIGYMSAQTVDFTVSYVGGNKCVSAGTSVLAQFTGQIGNTGQVDTVYWDCGDGTIYTYTDATTFPIKTYSVAGTYTVTLRVVYSTGATKTATHTVTVYAAPAFSFSKNTPDSICPGTEVTFTSTILPPSNTGAIRTYSWNFGDGGSSQAANPPHVYVNAANNPISMTVRLSIIDTNGCTGVLDAADYLFLHRKPVVRFSADQRMFCYNTVNTTATPTFINYTDTGVANANNTYLWNFGDGNTSTAINPQHTYGPGNYNVILRATSQYGCTDTLLSRNFIRIEQIIPNYTISNNFTDTTICRLPDTIRLEGIQGYNYVWNFKTLPSSTFYNVNRVFEPRFLLAHIGTHKLTVTITSQTNPECSIVDSSYTFHVYNNVAAVARVTDTNECDPDHLIRFKNNTVYFSADNFGLGHTTWGFRDGTSGTGDSTSHTYGTSATPEGGVYDGGYGHYLTWMATTTPYGCALDTVYQYVHIYRMHAVAAVTDPAPPAPPHGCAPHTVELTNILDSLVSSSPITSYVWRWDFVGNPYDTTNQGANPVVNHTYRDTGKFKVYLTLTNEQGCVHDIFVQDIWVGNYPKLYFTFDADTGCSSELSIPVHAFDSVDAFGNLVVTIDANGDTIPTAWANDWQWIDPDSGQPIATGKDASVHPTKVGESYIVMASCSHNGCETQYVVLDTIGYMCPPMATIKEPKDRDSGEPPLFCESQFINFVPEDVSKTGALYLRWFAGDMMDSTKRGDTTLGSKSPIFSHNDVGGGAWGFSYPDSVLLAQDGLILISLWAMNDNSATIDTNDSPLFNMCGYCEDLAQKILMISFAKMKFTVSPETICQEDSVVFFDSTYCNVGLFGWGFKIDSAANTNPNYLEPFMKAPYGNLGDMIVINNYTPMPEKGNGSRITFTRPNIYRAVLIDTCAFTCERVDTIRFRVYPKSIPDFISSADSATFSKGKDTVCVNSGGALYLKDASWSPSPFDSTKIIAWNWKFNKDTSSLQNPTLHMTTGNGWQDVSLNITNEFGCSSDTVAMDHVLGNFVVANFFAGMGDKKEFCNNELIAFTNKSEVMPAGVNQDNTRLKCVWEWGDGTTTVDTILSVAKNFKVIGHSYNFSTTTNKVIIKLTVSIVGNGGPIGCEAEYIDSLTISGPVAKFSYDEVVYPCPDDGTGAHGRQVKFENESEGTPTTLYWNFGDPTSGVANEVFGPADNLDYANPVHLFADAGQYTVMLIATDENQCKDSLVISNLVDISGPRGTFTYTPLDGCTNLQVTFKLHIPTTETTQKPYRPDTVYIYPGNGKVLMTAGDYMELTPIADVYTTGGIYIPIMEMIKKVTVNGVIHECRVQTQGKDTIYAIELYPNFDTAALYCPDVPATFANTTTWKPAVLPTDSIKWDFGDGNSSTEQDGENTYSVPGLYMVKIAPYIKSCTTKSKSYQIEVMNLPEVVFTPDTAQACDGLDVIFTADSLSALDKSRIISYKWEFEDAPELHEGNPISRGFTVSGEYPYKLTLEFLPDNCSKVYMDTVTIFAHKSPTAEFTPNPEEGEIDQDFTFTDNSIVGDGTIVTWRWDYGDGSTDSAKNNNPITHAYTSTSGVVLIKLLIEDEFGCVARAEHQILVTEKLAFPNIFTPMGLDGTRYQFRPMEDKGFFTEFKMEIYDRWGMLVWSSHCTAPNCPDYQGDNFWWNGTTKQGKKVSNGVYYWVVYASPLSEAKPFIKNGSVTILHSEN